jgi:hypothetical protein
MAIDFTAILSGVSDFKLQTLRLAFAAHKSMCTKQVVKLDQEES